MGKKQWGGERRCNLCGTPFNDAGPEFYDAQVYAGGRVTWGTVCYYCKHHVVSTGIGQVYDSHTFNKICNVQDRQRERLDKCWDEA